MYITFTNEKNFNTGKTSLEGSDFDNYNSELALKFFTIGAITDAVLTLKTFGLDEGIHFDITD